MTELPFKFLDTARSGWRLYRADTKAAQRRRRWADEDFKRMFPSGHEYSLRDYALAATSEDFLLKLDEKVPGHALRHIHPRALKLLVEYGVDYTPHRFEKDAYEQKAQPILGGCFSNSYFLMNSLNKSRKRTEQFSYVEGIAYGVMVQPVLHAWNSIVRKVDIAIDWTFYPSTIWTRYYGIPLTADEHTLIHHRSGENERMVSVLHIERFERLEKELIAILESREKNPSPAP